jgi:hypothetical protein
VGVQVGDHGLARFESEILLSVVVGLRRHGRCFLADILLAVGPKVSSLLEKKLLILGLYECRRTIVTG